MSNALELAYRLHREAFPAPRDPRSTEYKEGVLAALEFRLVSTDKPRCPYPPGTASADAWFSGTDEGNRRGREYMERSRP